MRTCIVDKLLPNPLASEMLRAEHRSKVSIYYFATYEEAQRWSKVAKHNGNIQWARGYDFGFMNPGEIMTVGEEFGVVFP